MPTDVQSPQVADGERDRKRVPPRDSPVWKTPMFDQYWLIRETLGPAAILFYRMGDFFEIFGADAVIAAPLLEVQLTARNKDAEIPVPMCGVPVHAIDSYAEKVLAHGYQVAICEQVSDPALARMKGGTKLVERRVSRILTPGLPVDHSRMDSKAPHWFLAVAPLPGSETALEVHALDFLGGLYHVGTVSDCEALIDLVRRLSPKEILLPANWITAPADCVIAEFLTAFAGRSVFTPWPGFIAATLVREYLVYTQRCDEEQLARLLPAPRSLNELLGVRDPLHARIPQKVLEQWAVFPELYNLLDRSGSVLGARRLRKILCEPLARVDAIELRQKLYGLYADHDQLRESTRDVYDLERILGRFRVGVASARELVQLKTSLDAVFKCLDSLPINSPTLASHAAAESLAPYAELRTRLEPLYAGLDRSLNTEVDVSRTDGLAPLLKAGCDGELDRLRSVNDTAETWLAEFEEGERLRTKITTLKVRYNRVFGFYIEIRKGHVEKVPADYERKQTTVQGERYTNRVLKEKEEEILTAGERLEAQARTLLEGFQNEVLANDADLRMLFSHFSWFDALLGVRHAIQLLSRHNGWTVPEVQAGPFFIQLVNARHPVIEALHGNFVPNSLELGVGKKRLLLLTGPNMAGKSTLMRQTGLCLLLAQCGFPVPAEKLTFAPCSGFFSRMGASDRILDGESTFMVEMKESAEILREADTNALVLIDEIGRGTSTQDGLAIAQAVLEHLHDHIQSLTIFATHYHELSETVQFLPNALNASMAIREWKGDLIFLRKVRFEPAESSYGIYVAKMAGLPPGLVQRSQKLLLLIKNSILSLSKRTGPSKNSASETDFNQLDIFSAAQPVDQTSAPHPLETELLAIDLDNTSPKEAWALLEKFKKRVETAGEQPAAETLGPQA